MDMTMKKSMDNCSVRGDCRIDSSMYENLEKSGLNKGIRENKRKRNGFTLIEMLIVVAIIGILAGIVAIKYGDVQKKAKENADYANASNIATAVYMAQSDGMNDSDISVDKLVEKKYLSSAPKPQSVEATGFKVSIENGVLKVTAGATGGQEKTFYPK